MKLQLVLQEKLYLLLDITATEWQKKLNQRNYRRSLWHIEQLPVKAEKLSTLARDEKPRGILKSIQGKDCEKEGDRFKSSMSKS